MNGYSSREENLNIISHGIGFIFSIVALVILVVRAYAGGDIRHIISVSIFGLSLILLYAASTLYHSAKKPQIRARLKILDHAAIYVLIAGSYTPFCIITLDGTIGWIILSISWIMAFTGIILKLFFTGRYEAISTLMYVLMGWMIVFFIQPLIHSLSTEGLQLLVAGGVSYTVGAVMYSLEKIKFNHAVFHIFVLVGSICHFFAVLLYVLPNN